MSINKEFFDGLDAALVEQEKTAMSEREAATWEPEEAGDTLKGIFLKVTYVADKFNPGKFKPIVVVKDIETDESVKVWGSRTALRNQLEQTHPSPGTQIGIRYGGFTDTPDGDYDGYHSYTVVVPPMTADDAKLGFEYWEQQRQQAVEAKQEERANKPMRPDEAPF